MPEGLPDAQKSQRAGGSVRESMAVHALSNEFNNRSVTYRSLTGRSVADAAIVKERDFDAHVFACLLAVAAMEEGTIGERLGLCGEDLTALVERWFPHARALSAGQVRGTDNEDDELVMVRDLLLAHRSTTGDDSRWLAAMLARRAMEPNHLWEDLGLRDRSELSRLLARHFAPLAVRNTKNMRWKRFFYRTLCEADGVALCTTPVCSSCSDFDLCFGEESGESRLAYSRREFALTEMTAA
jgi:nitrogen fixation protein NifQ